jgi:hypothetical protein
MGVTKCDKHGYSGISQFCVHVEKAYRYKEPTRAHAIIGLYGDYMMLCRECFDDAQSQVEKRERGSRSADYYGPLFDFTLAIPPASECFDGLAEWFTETGQGDLLNTINQARANYKLLHDG